MAEKFAGEEKLNTIVGQGTIIKGECTVNGTVRVDGMIDGSLTAKGMAIIGKSGQVKGDLIVHNGLIGGKIDGNVVAEGRLELQTGASVQGEITARRLVVEEGVFFHGACKMKEQAVTQKGGQPEKEEKPKPGAPKTSPAPASKVLSGQAPHKFKVEESGKDTKNDDLTFHGQPL